jgi:hypothetical protein
MRKKRPTFFSGRAKALGYPHGLGHMEVKRLQIESKDGLVESRLGGHGLSA